MDSELNDYVSPSQSSPSMSTNASQGKTTAENAAMVCRICIFKII